MGKMFVLGLACVFGVMTAAVAEEGKPGAEEVPLTNAKAHVFREGAFAPLSGPLRLGLGPHLFIDDYLIASVEGIQRTVNTPQRDAAIANPIVTGKEDGCFQPYMTIVRDPESKRFRIWYGHHVEDFNAGRSHIGHMESDDGIHWERPARVLDDPAPIQFGVSIIDQGPAFSPRAQRFVYGWWMDGGLRIAVSPGGLAWTPLSPDTLLYHNHDINGISYDPLRERYVATASVYRPGSDWEGKRRITMHAFSRDLLEWSTPHYVVLPDSSIDEGQTQFYAMDGYLVRGELIIGMVKVLRDDLKADNPPDPPEAYGMGYTSLAWTRDGETWFRDPVHFFDPHPEKGQWDHAHAWIDEQVLVGDDVYLYYAGYARGHKVNRFEERQIGLVTLPRDRYVAREAGAETGTLRTRLLTLAAGRLTLNAEVQEGSVRVQVLDQAGNPIPGYAYDDMQPITSGQLEAPVTWQESLAALKGKPIQLEFTLKNAKLYAMTLE